MSDAADIFGQPVSDPEQARESFAAAGIYAGEPSATSDERGDDILKGRWPWSMPLRRECDFKFADCQLGHGHALPHCTPDPDGSGSYLMVDDDGRILREI